MSSGNDDGAGDIPMWVRAVGTEWVRRHGMTVFGWLFPPGALLTTGSVVLFMLVNEGRGGSGPLIRSRAVASVTGVDTSLLVGAGMVLGLSCTAVGYEFGRAADSPSGG